MQQENYESFRDDTTTIIVKTVTFIQILLRCIQPMQTFKWFYLPYM
jgi:hypothetical protein